MSSHEIDNAVISAFDTHPLVQASTLSLVGWRTLVSVGLGQGKKAMLVLHTPGSLLEYDDLLWQVGILSVALVA